LWISLFANAETLDLTGLRTSCPLSRHHRELNEINNLERSSKIVMMRRNRRRDFYDRTKSWG